MLAKAMERVIEIQTALNQVVDNHKALIGRLAEAQFFVEECRKQSNDTPDKVEPAVEE